MGEAREVRVIQSFKMIEEQTRAQFSGVATRYGLEMRQSQFARPLFNELLYRYPFRTEQAKAIDVELFKILEDAVSKNAGLGNFDGIQKTLVALVDRDASLAPAMKTQMTQKIKETEILLPSQYISKYVTTFEDLTTVLGRAIYDGAWNAEQDNRKRVILLFPGIIAARPQSGSTSFLNFVLAHEISHSIDYDSFPGAYGAMSSCFENNLKVGFKEWTEITADAWGAKVMASELTAASATPQAALEHLRESVEILCGTSGEAHEIVSGLVQFHHPSGEFRINNVIGANPDIRRLIGCEANASAACFQ